MTQQIRDTLQYKNETYYLEDEILESYFAKHPERKPKRKTVMTALWRGYVAAFEIVDGELFVNNIELTPGNRNIDVAAMMNKAFPVTKKMDWYSGYLRIEDYKQGLDERKPGFLFRFLEIQNGNLKNCRTMNGEEFQQFKKERLEYFKTTDEYARVFKIWRSADNERTDVEIDEIIAEHILIYLQGM